MNRKHLLNESISPYYAAVRAEPEASRNVFLNEFALLPSSLKDLLTSNETSEAITTLSDFFDLDALQTELTAWAIRNVAIGDTYIKEFPVLLARLTDLDLKKSTDMSNYIIRNVFAPVLEDIKKIQIQKFGSRSQSDRGSSISQPNQNSGEIGTSYPGEDLPETGGNIIDLRKISR